MRFRLHQQICVGALLAVALLGATPAWGLPSNWDSIVVTLHGLGSADEPVLIVRGTLHPAVELPTVVYLPVPADPKVRWVGEVHGDNPLNDTVAAFEARSVGSGDELCITMQRGRTVQAEMDPPLGWAVVRPDGTFVEMEWTAIERVDHVWLAFEVPDDMHAERLRPRTASVTNTGDENVYAIDANRVDAGDVLTLTGMVVPGAATATATATAKQSVAGVEPELVGSPHETSPLLLAIVTLCVAAILVALVFALRKRPPQHDQPGGTPSARA